MSSTQYLTDVATRHQVFIERYGNGQAKQARKTLKRLTNKLEDRLNRSKTSFQIARNKTLLSDLTALSSIAFDDISADIVSSANDFAISENKYNANLYNNASKVELNIANDAALTLAVANTKLGLDVNSKITVSQALNQFKEKKTKQILNVINDGTALGDTTPQIISKLKTVMGTIQSRQVSTLARTITNHAASVARSELYKANNDILNGYKWLSTLDGRTTLICGSRDNVVYSNYKKDPMPPAHYNCRSTTIPVMKPEYDIGAEIGGKRSSLDGAINSKTTYGGWLKKQPKEFIDEALGVERSKLFRSGKYKISDFVDPTGKVYTLDELEATSSIANLGF